MERRSTDPAAAPDATDREPIPPESAETPDFSDATDAPESDRTFSRFALILVLALAAAAALFFFLRGRQFPAAAASATPVPETALPQLDENFHGLAMWVLDIGQGDCIFFRSPSGKTMLVDAGPAGSFGRIHLFLKRQNVTRLDVVVCTHLHGDHIGSMAEILGHYEVGTLYLPPFDLPSSEYANMLEAMEAANVQAETVSAAVTPLPEWDPDCALYVLAPYDVHYDDENDTSIVLRVEYGVTAALLMGDATELSERLAIKALPNHLFHANVLKVGHHGSASSTGKKLVATVQPEIAIISVGIGNSYGLPDEAVIARLRNAGARVLRTDLDKTVLIALDGERAWVVE